MPRNALSPQAAPSQLSVWRRDLDAAQFSVGNTTSLPLFTPASAAIAATFKLLTSYPADHHAAWPDVRRPWSDPQTLRSGLDDRAPSLVMDGRSMLLTGCGTWMAPLVGRAILVAGSSPTAGARAVLSARNRGGASLVRAEGMRPSCVCASKAA